MNDIQLRRNTCVAIKTSNIDDALMYIQQIEDVNFTFTLKEDAHGCVAHDYTLLHFAAEKGLDKVVEALLNKGADAKEARDTRVTPLYIALERKKELANKKTDTTNLDKIITLLIENKPEHCAIPGYIYNTPLHLAASSPFMTEQLELILSCQDKAEINVCRRDNDGNTPLHLAAQCNNLEAVELLVKNGASITCRNSDHKTAAELTNNKDIKQYLEKNKNIQHSKVPNTLFDCTTYPAPEEAVTLHSREHRIFVKSYDESRLKTPVSKNDNDASPSKSSRFCIIS